MNTCPVHTAGSPRHLPAPLPKMTCQQDTAYTHLTYWHLLPQKMCQHHTAYKSWRHSEDCTILPRTRCTDASRFHRRTGLVGTIGTPPYLCSRPRCLRHTRSKTIRQPCWRKFLLRKARTCHCHIHFQNLSSCRPDKKCKCARNSWHCWHSACMCPLGTLLLGQSNVPNRFSYTQSRMCNLLRTWSQQGLSSLGGNSCR